MYFTAARTRIANPMTEPKSVLTTDYPGAMPGRVRAMRRLLSPVNAGMSAARHVIWYVRYHASGPQRPVR